MHTLTNPARRITFADMNFTQLYTGFTQVDLRLADTDCVDQHINHPHEARQ